MEGGKDMLINNLPPRIAAKVYGLPHQQDTIGMSGSTILLFDEMVLKIEKTSRSSINEQKLLAWLDGKLPAPRMIEAETRDETSYLLMSKLPGEMACSDHSLRNMESTVIALAKGLQMLWQMNTQDSPCANIVADKLEEVRYRLDHNLVDASDFEPETFGAEGFRDAEDLYNYLDKNRPAEDLVFSHGDFCLPNVFISGRDVTGFLDWGRGGIADRWQDIALCVRSLRFNHVEHAGYSEADYEKYKAMLFSELGMKPDEEKLRYYVLLDELF
jgi:kanamycin kinase/aminoglycoside 3'-phosphotransferase-3